MRSCTTRYASPSQIPDKSTVIAGALPDRGVEGLVVRAETRIIDLIIVGVGGRRTQSASYRVCENFGVVVTCAIYVGAIKAEGTVTGTGTGALRTSASGAVPIRAGARRQAIFFFFT